jgi:hypothetical protein
MRPFTTFRALSCAAVLGGCAKTEKQTAADTSAVADEAPAPAAISLADVAGKWHVRGMSQTGDSTLVTFELNATPNPSGWTFHFPNRKPIPVRVTTAGDSIMTEAGPYQSVLRKGVQVTTRGVLRLEGDKLVGTTVARYAGSSRDSLRVRTEATRMP